MPVMSSNSVRNDNGWGTNAEFWLYRVNKTTFTVQAIP